MTTTTPEAAPKPKVCRCGATITKHQESTNAYADECGDLWCPDGKLHAPVCPPSGVRDMIVQWPDVKPGDLAIYLGRLDLVEDVAGPADWAPGRVRILHGGSWHCPRADEWTAVRRYVEGVPGPSQRDRIAAAAGSVHIGDVDPGTGHLFPGDQERIADAIVAALGTEG